MAFMKWKRESERLFCPVLLEAVETSFCDDQKYYKASCEPCDARMRTRRAFVKRELPAKRELIVGI